MNECSVVYRGLCVNTIFSSPQIIRWQYFIYHCSDSIERKVLKAEDWTTQTLYDWNYVLSPLYGECSNPLPYLFKLEMGLTSYYFLAESNFYLVFKPDIDTFLHKGFYAFTIGT